MDVIIPTNLVCALLALPSLLHPYSTVFFFLVRYETLFVLSWKFEKNLIGCKIEDIPYLLDQNLF